MICFKAICLHEPLMVISVKEVHGDQLILFLCDFKIDFMLLCLKVSDLFIGYRNVLILGVKDTLARY